MGVFAKRWDRVTLLVWLVAAAGVAWRAWLASDLYPWTGDPTYSYAYRAMLIAHGDWGGVFLAWHPPGYPLLLAALTWMSRGVLSPYGWGTVVSLASSAGLVLVIDRLLAPRVRWPATRLVSASFLAFYEGLFVWGTGPLTEPFYLLLVYAALLLADRDRVGLGRAVLIGALFGLANTTRMEGAAGFFGVGTWLAFRAATAPSPRRLRGLLAVSGGLTLGWLLSFGWMFLHVDYLSVCRRSMESGYTIPLAHGIGANLSRLVTCGYYACTNWLPQVLLLPYWMLLALGLFASRKRITDLGRLQGLLLALVLPCLLAIGWSIMHKRTGTVLLPAAAVWISLGCEAFARRFGAHCNARVIIALVLLVNVLLGMRYFAHRAREGSVNAPATLVAANILRAGAAEPGPVWAFSAQPEIYYFWGVPIEFPIFDEKDLSEVHYGRHAGDPAGFIADLRQSGYQYLVFSMDGGGDSSSAGNTVRQPHGPREPLRSDLEALVRYPADYHLETIGTGAAERGRVSVHVFRIDPP